MLCVSVFENERPSTSYPCWAVTMMMMTVTMATCLSASMLTSRRR